MPDWKSIFSAAPVEQVARIRELLEKGVDAEAPAAANGWTPLMIACDHGGACVEAVELLLDRGADPNARKLEVADDWSAQQMDELIEESGVELPPEIREMMESVKSIREDPRSSKPRENAVLALAVGKSDVAVVRLLIERGADVRYVSPLGYTLLVTAACRGCEEIFKLLIEAGAPLDGESDYGESALSVISSRGKFAMVGRLLEAGADPAPLEWTPLHRAVALGSLADVAAALEGQDDLEGLDRWERTPFLLSLHSGDTAKVAFLLARGANRHAKGRCGKPPHHYPIERDDALTLDWLIHEGFDLNERDDFQNSALQIAIEHRAVACVRRLLAAGLDWNQRDEFDHPLIHSATDPEIIRLLVELGADLADLEPEPLRDWIGLGTVDALPVDEAEFVANRTRRFGVANPEKMDVPFWRGMVRNGWSGYQAASHFDKESYGGPPVWCHQRFGMSLTALPDGRFVQIAGEHEDHYDPDFCIYNDVVIHDGHGGFEILGYPEEVFPSTDFHSATLIGDWIYIIGNLGYPRTRDAFNGETPVFRLHVGSWEIERINTSTPTPGWIHRHTTTLQDGTIHVSGGKIFTVDDEGQSHIGGNTRSWSFHPDTTRWQLLDS